MVYKDECYRLIGSLVSKKFSRFARFIILIFLCAILPITKASGGTNTFEIALQYHCAGLAELSANTNLIAVNKLLARRSTVNFQKVALERFSRIILDALHLQTNAADLSPLLSDLLQSDSVGAFGRSSNSLSFILALPANNIRAQLWHDVLAQFPQAAFWTQRAQNWLLVGFGPDLRPWREEYLRKIQAYGTPYLSALNPWLSADINWSRLSAFSELLKPARVHLEITPKSGNLETAAQISFAEPTAWQAAPWQLPTNLVRDPLISFTAGQNLAAFFNATSPFIHLDANPLTNQFYAWAMGQMPFQTYMAWPVGNTNALKMLAPELTNVVNAKLHRYNGTELGWFSNQEKLVWEKMRVVGPSLGLTQQINGPFLLLSFFPLFPAPNPAPKNLWSQLQDRPNLVYYDWEMTGVRLQQWRLLWKVLSSRPIATESDETEASEASWLSGFDATIGRSTTEITCNKPNEFSLFRQSPLGLTGIEIVLLSDWVSGGPAFVSFPKN